MKKRTITNCSGFIFSLCLILRKASNDQTDYAELLFPQRHPNTSLRPNNSLLPSPSHPISQEDIPPALPYRPNNLRNSAVLSASSQSNRLNLTVEEYPHVPNSFPATVMGILVDWYSSPVLKLLTDVMFWFYQMLSEQMDSQDITKIFIDNC